MAECKKNNVGKKREVSFDVDLENIEEDSNKEQNGDDDEPEVGTQPIELLSLNEENPDGLSEDMFADNSCIEVWGWLQPTPNSKLQAVALQKEAYSFGRHIRCDFVFKEEQFQDDSLFLSISKCQFKLEREAGDKDNETVFLSDMSMNGTFVNKQKVGKGERVVLINNDVISLIFPQNRVFVFVDNSSMHDWMPVEMREKFNLKIILGNGSFGEVRMAHNKINNKDVAIKKIKKRAGKEHMVENEIDILRKLKHRFIVSMEDVFDSQDYVFIVLEYISGGTLSSKVDKYGKLMNDDAKLIFYQLVLALEFLHEQGVAHRDLKPDNVLLARYEEGEIVKISDFGLSKLSSLVDTDLKTICGTPCYTAPEVLLSGSLGNYTHQVDIWSLGVSLFYCLSGTHPFYTNRDAMPVTEQIIRGSYSMMGAEWRGVCSKSMNIIRKMLIVDPAQRITLPEILNHPWFKDDNMKNRLTRVLRCASEGKVSDENLRTENSRPSKRARQEPSDTLRKS